MAVALFCCSAAMAQDGEGKSTSAKSGTIDSGWGLTSGRYAVKTNVLMDLAGAVNLGVEVALCNRFSVDIPLYYSPYAYADSWSLKGFAVQPELRFWLGKGAFSGCFVGVHGEMGVFNVATSEDYRYESYNNEPSWGVGLSCGYAMKLSERLGAEFAIGAGYVDMTYNKYYNTEGGKLVDENVQKDYWGLTKLSIGLSYSF